MKKLCLCITNYNKEKFLDRAIRSCLSQIQNNLKIEVILVNDGSKAFKKKEILSEYPDIRVFSYKKNKGVSYASNLAINKVKSDYFMRVDADDYISTKSSLILSEVLKDNPEIPFVYGDILKVQKKKKAQAIKRNTKKTLLEHGAGIMFRTKLLKNIGGYDQSLKNCEDFDLIMRMIIKYGNGHYIPVSYYRYYFTAGSHLSQSNNRRKHFSFLKKKYEKYLSKDII